MRTSKLEEDDSISLQYAHQHLNALPEDMRVTALELLESLATRPAGRILQTLPHDLLPEEGLGAQRALSVLRAKTGGPHA